MTKWDFFVSAAEVMGFSSVNKKYEWKKEKKVWSIQAIKCSSFDHLKDISSVMAWKLRL